jgi:gamma-glutamyl-gamma-aminobutyrate hydrolase PuuD
MLRTDRLFVKTRGVQCLNLIVRGRLFKDIGKVIRAMPKESLDGLDNTGEPL